MLTNILYSDFVNLEDLPWTGSKVGKLHNLKKREYMLNSDEQNYLDFEVLAKLGDSFYCGDIWSLCGQQVSLMELHERLAI